MIRQRQLLQKEMRKRKRMESRDGTSEAVTATLQVTSESTNDKTSESSEKQLDTSSDTEESAPENSASEDWINEHLFLVNATLMHHLDKPIALKLVEDLAAARRIITYNASL